MRVLFACVALLNIGFWALIQGPLPPLWNGFAFAFVLGGGLTIYLAAHGTRAFRPILDWMYTPKGPHTRERNLNLSRHLASSFIATGWIGTGLVAISLCSKLGDWTALPPALFNLIHPVLYGFVCAVFVRAIWTYPLSVPKDTPCQARNENTRTFFGIRA